MTTAALLALSHSLRPTTLMMPTSSMLQSLHSPQLMMMTIRCHINCNRVTAAVVAISTHTHTHAIINISDAECCRREWQLILKLHRLNVSKRVREIITARQRNDWRRTEKGNCDMNNIIIGPIYNCSRTAFTATGRGQPNQPSQRSTMC